MAKSRARARKQVRMNIVIAGMVMLGLAVGLGLYAFRGNVSFFASPSEIVAGQLVSGETLESGTRLRLGGLVEEDSWQQSDDGVVHFFRVTDEVQAVKVEYSGILPDLFREGQGVVLTGQMNDKGVFMASEVLAKHDENYMPKEAVDAMKRAGTWKHAEEAEDAGDGSGQ
ncbi:cytochrome c maturation protein CcmE [Aestuariispira insulae]|uniref:Cytochrome c-type biogenesis protein CcmE n=1 Tax=Aestuariispira insulae TaxID=1461337 RepID=A0A3D9HQ27_9PROT|nr:cytochrome c maturation protein CcmE [Aestuariispira insulae]RED51559.1 cytochrome c-type biogenesis protein CcmE [Aestuariispira insulae]